MFYKLFKTEIFLNLESKPELFGGIEMAATQLSNLTPSKICTCLVSLSKQSKTVQYCFSIKFRPLS